ncbi:MAG: patatin-like phospholipase family protein [Parcubacteria group bacterium]|nr:patatin-like phospholipase family protein [Parcubacteria group bacterium]
MKHQKVGIILPSGGCKCAFQAGALKAITEYIPKENIPYLQVVSGGTFNGAKFISDDFTADPLIRVWQDVERMGVGQLFDLLTIILNQAGRNKPNKRVEELIKKIDAGKIIASHARLDIIARNLNTNEAELFSSKSLKTQGNNEKYLIKLILASASIPGIMPPVHINGMDYCDGFVWIPEALEDIKKMLDLIIVIDPEHQIDPFTPALRPILMPAGSWKSLGGSNYIYFDNLKKSLRMLEMIVGRKKILIIKPIKTYQNLTVVNFSKGEISDSIDQGYKLTIQALQQI